MSQLIKPDKPIKISVDAMGGDYAPGEIVKGAIQAARKLGVELFLVGIKDKIETEIEKLDTDGLSINIIAAKDVIVDGEQAAYAVMKKPDSSVVIAAKMVKDGKADGMISAGPTGAIMVAALHHMGTIPGMERPVICTPIIGFAAQTVIVDLGANIGCQPYQFVEFAAAGSVYAMTQLGIERPTVGLLNVGAEKGKGYDIIKEAYELLEKSGLNFIGNVEGMDIPRGKVNVVVCDGFVGNILIKFSEGLGRIAANWMRAEIGNKMQSNDLNKVVDNFYWHMSPGSTYGGIPLCGVDGVVSVAHGNSRADQIENTIRNTKAAIESGFVSKLKEEFETIRKRINPAGAA
jgi:glycerol-3-phosphate acyltransferase PlsX